jgi:glucuronate isomerase
MNRNAEEIYAAIAGDPIVSPHGHCDPAWFAENARFKDPTDLILIPDHYLFRMLYSQGVALEDLGIGGSDHDPRAVFRMFADHWHLFLGTPSHAWLSYMFETTFGISAPFSPDTAEEIYDAIDAKLGQPDYLPHALFERFNIEVLATTDGATDDLAAHQAIRDSSWTGRVIPTFRPDAVLDPRDARFAVELDRLGAMTGRDVGGFDGYVQAIRDRRAAFKALGATATDHAIEVLTTDPLDRAEAGAIFARARSGDISDAEAQRFYGHMLTLMAEMSVDDGLVMQLHVGSRRNTNHQIMERFGRDMGADIPVATDWVRGLDGLLNRVGNTPGFSLIAFTLDETTYARELAPMAGHWPCLKIGPPWWFHDSEAGIARYFDQVVETAGYWNLAGFNDDTRAFMSIPARHDVWRRGVAHHLGEQVTRGAFGIEDAHVVARALSTGLARDVYRLGKA